MSGLFGAGGGSLISSPPSPAATGASPSLHATGTGSLLQVGEICTCTIGPKGIDYFLFVLPQFSPLCGSSHRNILCNESSVKNINFDTKLLNIASFDIITPVGVEKMLLTAPNTGNSLK